MSSRWTEGYSFKSSSMVSPLASMWIIWCTGIRVPLTQACPWQIFGSIMIRSCIAFAPILVILSTHSVQNYPHLHYTRVPASNSSIIHNSLVTLLYPAGTRYKSKILVLHRCRLKLPLRCILPNNPRLFLYSHLQLYSFGCRQTVEHSLGMGAEDAFGI